MPLHIPESSRDALILLNEMSDASASALDDAIAAAAPSVSIRALAQEISSKTQLDNSQATKIVEALYGLFSISPEVNNQSEKVVSDVIRAMKVATPDAMKSWDPLQRRLAHLLSSTTGFGLTAKGMDVATESENVYFDARILTDLRPIFLADPPERPVANVVIHNLKIEFMRNRETKEIYFALNPEEVKSLQEVLTRALAKERVLRAISEASGIPIFESSSQEE
jgi:hypothetical protein